MNSVTFIPLITFVTCSENNYDFGVPKGQNTNGTAPVYQTEYPTNVETRPGPQGCVPEFMPLVQPAVTVQEVEATCGVYVTGHGGAEAASHGYVHARAEIENPPSKLRKISDERERQLFDWVASLEGDSEYQHGSGSGSGSGNSAGVDEQMQADSHPYGLEQTLWRMSVAVLLAAVLIRLEYWISPHWFVGGRYHSESTRWFDSSEPMSLSASMNKWSESMNHWSERISGFIQNLSASQALFTNQNLLWRATLSSSCVVGYMWCRNVLSQIKLDNATGKSYQETMIWAVCLTAGALHALHAFALACNLVDDEVSAASAIFRIFLAGLAPFVVKAESFHSMRVLLHVVALPAYCACQFASGPVGRANSLAMSNPDPLSMQTLWKCALVTPWLHLTGMTFNVSLPFHLWECFGVMGLLAMFGSCQLIESSPVLVIQACISVLSCIFVAAKIAIIQHYFAPPQSHNDESPKVSELRHLLVDIKRETQVLHRRVELFQRSVAKIKPSDEAPLIPLQPD